MYFATVRGEIWIPSLIDSSLAIRSWPQIGLSAAILLISARRSGGITGLPGREFQRQNRRNPARCHRRNVRGVTLTRAPGQSKHFESNTRDTRVAASVRRGSTPRSRYIATCLRRNRFSSATTLGGRRSSQANATRSASSRRNILAPGMAPESCHLRCPQHHPRWG